MTREINNTKDSKSIQSKFTKTTLASAISLSLSFATNTAEFNVTESTDNGTGLVANTLSWAILQANTTLGDDTITLSTDVTITGVMKRLIDSNTTLHSDEIRRTIDGDNNFRPLFIKSGNVLIEDIDMINGLAKGGNSESAGVGAGMGGSIFIYDGNIDIYNVSISDSIASPGILKSVRYNNGGGGMFGEAKITGGGGLFASSITNQGAYGGFGNYRDIDPKFGEGGIFLYNNESSSGGFGGGGSFGYIASGGNGGFGAGGGNGYYSYGGNGGFGAGGGSSYYNSNGLSGFGGNANNSAAMGGAIFIRSGIIDLKNVNIENSTATAVNGALGLGGALFILHSLTNSNENNQGMPTILPLVKGCNLNFDQNIASGDTNASNNNDDVFYLGNNFTNQVECRQEIEILGNGIVINDDDNNPNIENNTYFGDVFFNSESISQSYIINNIGLEVLNLTGKPIVEISGENSSDFSVTVQPQSTALNYTESTSFEVRFLPSSIGLKTAIVIIENNDEDENPYNFIIQGIGKGPEITISGNSIDIEDGNNSPNLSDFTYFGVDQQQHTFVIENNGVSDLNLTTFPIIQLTGSDISDFSVILQPSSNVINPQTLQTFEIEFNPTSPGIKLAIVNIANDDLDESTFSFTIQGGGPPAKAVFNVTESTDDGTGLVENTLSWAILQANNEAGDNTIILNASVKLTGVMKRLINSNIILKSDEIIRTIDGDERFRPLFIKSGNVLIENINISKGHARGANSSGSGGGGAGMGGSIFIYSGNVTLSNSTIQNSSTSTFSSDFARSGGGMYGTGGISGGGGLFASYESGDQEGGYGGYGNYDNVNVRFGKGGRLFRSDDGGFGGGGAYYQNANGGKGGFGGGGGYSLYENGGDGGFGGGSARASSSYSGKPGIAGYGAYKKDAASMGGAIFIRSGNVKLENVFIEYSQAIAKNGAKGLGGAIFIMHTTNHENGNNQGMPFELPIVSACNLSLTGNVASGDPNTINNNDDLFDLNNIFNDLGCPIDLIFKNNFEQ